MKWVQRDMCSRLLLCSVIYFSLLDASQSVLKLAPSVQEVVRYVNESYIVTCSSEDKKPVTWFSSGMGSGRGLQVGERGHPYVSPMSSGTALVFERISSVDRGRYTCVLDDETIAFKLVVISPISFMETPLLQTAQEHHPSVVKCQVLGDPKPKVLWKFDGRDVTSDRYAIIHEGLMIKNVSLEDRGMYTCRAYQVSQVTSMYEDRNIKLNIQHKPMFKKMVHAKVNQAYGFVGGEVNLTCEAVAEPAANFTWFRPYKRFTKLQGKIYQKRHWSMMQLYIHNASMFGDYLCKATNSLGTLDQIVTLLEGVKPPPPVHMLLRGVSSDTFNIEVQGPDLNRTDIPSEMLPFGYRIQYRRKTNEKMGVLDGQDKWIGADTTDFYDVNVGGFYIINGLTDNTEYEIRAATRNIAGISDYTREVTYRTLRSHAQADSITSGTGSNYAPTTLLLITLAINFVRFT